MLAPSARNSAAVRIFLQASVLSPSARNSAADCDLASGIGVGPLSEELGHRLRLDLATVLAPSPRNSAAEVGVFQIRYRVDDFGEKSAAKRGAKLRASAAACCMCV